MKKLLLTVTIVVALAACGKPSKIDVPDKVDPGPITPMTCMAFTIPASCGNTPGTGPGTPHVNLNFNNGPNPIQVNPPNVCAQTTRTITFKISPGNLEPGSVAIIPKKPLEAPWLTGTNSVDNKEIKIPVPGWVIPNEQNEGYDYYVYYGGNCLDPRAHVM